MLRKPCVLHGFLRPMFRKPRVLRGFLKPMLRKPCVFCVARFCCKAAMSPVMLPKAHAPGGFKNQIFGPDRKVRDKERERDREEETGKQKRERTA